LKSVFKITILFISIVILTWNGITNAASPNYQVFTRDSNPYGTPYNEWFGKWWTWWFGIPNDIHPVNNYSDSKRCASNQSGPVWFLPDVVGGKGKINIECNVPLGKGILLPLTTTICERGIETEELAPNLAECADNIMTPLENIKVTVDGVPVDVEKLNGKTGLFNVTFPDNPIKEVYGNPKPGTYPWMATGYFLFLHDLTPGIHKIDLNVADWIKGNPKPDNPREGTFQILVK
jgi:hypothetical protein